MIIYIAIGKWLLHRVRNVVYYNMQEVKKHCNERAMKQCDFGESNIGQEMMGKRGYAAERDRAGETGGNTTTDDDII